MEILIVNGPNLNMLGKREPENYGYLSLNEINEKLQIVSVGLGCGLCISQSNAESELIDIIHAAPSKGVNFIIFNPAAFTHTSIALRDAIMAVQIPFIEVHLSNVHAREDFRKHSYFSDIAVGVISGLGAKGYELALLAAIDILKQK